jgi:parallel beta-helix repeat protein
MIGMRIKLYILCTVFLQGFISYGQILDWSWVRSAGGLYTDKSYSISTDYSGNIYTTGFYVGTANFGSLSLPGFGEQDIFIAKYNPSGNPLWVRRIGGIWSDHGYAVGNDKSGNCYVTGRFNYYAYIGTDTLSSSGAYTIFLAKFDSAGNYLWVKQAVCDSYSYGNGISVDSSGNSFITGSYADTAHFDSITLYPSSNNHIMGNIFIAKYNTNGDILWAKQAGGKGSDEARAITTDPFGNVYITGVFSDTAFFDTTIIISKNIWNIFVAKYSIDGNFLWVRSMSRTGNIGGSGIACNSVGNCFVTGSFQDTLTIDSTTLVSYGLSDIFIAEYNSSGDYIWAKRAGGSGNDAGKGISADIKNNSFFLTGSFENHAIFDTTELTSNGGTDIFIAEYDNTGNVKWVKSVGGIQDDEGNGITSDNQGSVYFTGDYSSPSVYFDTIFLHDNGNSNIFIGKLSEATAEVNELNYPENEVVSVYPNPSKYTLTIEVTGKACIEILNVKGQIIKTFNYYKGENSIDIKDLPGGVYIIKVKTDKGVMIKKFIKE